jgi:hypothetical protein
VIVYVPFEPNTVLAALQVAVVVVPEVLKGEDAQRVTGEPPLNV